MQSSAVKQTRARAAGLVTDACCGSPGDAAELVLVCDASGRTEYVSQPARLLLANVLLGESLRRVFVRLVESLKGTESAIVGDFVARITLLEGGSSARFLVKLERSREDSMKARVSERASAWSLTPRQRDVLAGVADALTNKELCERLGCSLPTIETHLSAVLRKAGAMSRQELLVALWKGGRGSRRK